MSNNIFKDKKNIAIVALSILLVLFIGIPSNSTEYETTLSEQKELINTLRSETENLTTKLTDYKTQIAQLQNTNQKLEAEIEELKNQDIDLTTNSQQAIASTSNTKNTNKSSDNSNITNNITNAEMVWVGDTGTKYHIQSCRTLKGNGHQITLKQALSENREPCKVCH